MEPIVVPKGLDGVIVDDSAICTADSDNGTLIYRGYSAVELAEKASFEQTAYLIVYGKLPGRNELAEFSQFLKKNEEPDSNTKKIMALINKDTAVIDLMRSVVSLVPTNETKQDRVLLEIAAKMPHIAADGYRLINGAAPLPSISGTYAERFYYQLTGKNDAEAAKYLEKLLILYMEHEMNASTFALRVTASTLADPRAALTTALATIKGPLHGGANDQILNYIVKMDTKDEAVKFVDDRLARKEKIMGFGHRIYKKVDPRAQFMKKELDALSRLKHTEKLYDIAAAIEETVWDRKKLPANLDFYAALIMHLLGIDHVFYTPIFASSRSFGWAAHYLEQVGNNKLIRPDSRYIGPTGLKLR
jgi:citrate synthase